MASSARCPTLLLLLLVVGAEADRASDQKGAEAPTTPAAEAPKHYLARWPSAAETLITGGVSALTYAAVHLTPLGVPVITTLAGWGFLGPVGTTTGYLLVFKSAHAAFLAATAVACPFFVGARLAEAPYFEAPDAAATPPLLAHDGAEDATTLRRLLDEEMAHSARHRREAAAAAAALEAEQRRTAGGAAGAALEEAEAQLRRAEAELQASREAAEVAARAGGEEAAVAVRRLQAEAAELKGRLRAAEAHLEMMQETLAKEREARAGKEAEAELSNERLHQWLAKAAEAEALPVSVAALILVVIAGVVYRLLAVPSKQPVANFERAVAPRFDGLKAHAEEADTANRQLLDAVAAQMAGFERAVALRLDRVEAALEAAAHTDAADPAHEGGCDGAVVVCSGQHQRRDARSEADFEGAVAKHPVLQDRPNAYDAYDLLRVAAAQVLVVPASAFRFFPHGNPLRWTPSLFQCSSVERCGGTYDRDQRGEEASEARMVRIPAQGEADPLLLVWSGVGSRPHARGVRVTVGSM